MLDDIKIFFDRFAEDVSTFDGGVIASKYLAPYMAVSRDGDVWLCSNQEELVDYFQTLLNRHSSQGVKTCTYEDLEFSTIGNSCYLATVTWSMRGEDGEAIQTWRESYNMRNADGGLRVFCSIDH